MKLTKDEIESLIENKTSEAVKKYGSDVKFAILEIVNLEKMLVEDNKQSRKPSRLIPISEWNNYHDYPTVGAIRQYRFNGDKNGFNNVIEFGGNSGGRLLINEDKMFEWLSNRDGLKKAS